MTARARGASSCRLPEAQSARPHGTPARVFRPNSPRSKDTGPQQLPEPPAPPDASDSPATSDAPTHPRRPPHPRVIVVKGFLLSGSTVQWCPKCGVPKPGTPNPRGTQHFSHPLFGVPKIRDTEYGGGSLRSRCTLHSLGEHWT